MKRASAWIFAGLTLLLVGLNLWSGYESGQWRDRALARATEAKSALVIVETERARMVVLEAQRDSALNAAGVAHARAAVLAKRVAARVIPPAPLERPDTCRVWIARADSLAASLTDYRANIADLLDENGSLRAVVQRQDSLAASAVRALAAATPVVEAATRPVRPPGVYLFGLKIPTPSVSVGYGVVYDPLSRGFHGGPGVSVGFRIPLGSR